jgi:hypothetical protein
MVPIDALVAVIAVVQLLVHALVQVVTQRIARAPHDELREMLEGMAKSAEVHHHMVSELYEMHKQTDPRDGRPLWFFPAGMADIAREQLGLIREIAQAQRDLAKVLDGIVKQLERFDRRAERCADGKRRPSDA